MPRLSIVSIGFLLCGLPLFAQPNCISGNTLYTYETLAAGCDIGPFTVKDFNFTLISDIGLSPITAADITVTVPPPGSSVFGYYFALAFSGFQVTAAQSLDYSIAYTWDPTPDIRGLGDILDPPSGAANITTVGCLNSAFAGVICPTSTVTLNVSPGGPNAFVAIPAPDQTLGIIETVNLDDGLGTASGFGNIENDAYAPEPEMGVLTAALGALLLAAKIRLRKA